MERTVPSTESEEVDLYTRTYNSLLRTTAEVKIRTLEEVHSGMNSLLHRNSREPQSDMSAFIYSLLRLPYSMPDVKLIVLGQNAEMFASAGYGDIREWEEVFSMARRRRSFFDGNSTLACYISSRSDIDDIVPLLTAYQIEWNKLHHRLSRVSTSIIMQDLGIGVGSYARLAEALEVHEEDLERLYAIWDRDLGLNFSRIAESQCDLRIRLLSGSLTEYRRARNSWWDNIEFARPDIGQKPVYFISSNTHSLANILSGFALKKERDLIKFLKLPGNTGLANEWNDIQAGDSPSSCENFLYYLLRKTQRQPEGIYLIDEQQAHEQKNGILRIPSKLSFDVEAQIVDINCLSPKELDPRLGLDFKKEKIAESDALILNIDYPLGLAAYDILAEVSARVGSILGVYVMGKAATLNGIVGDVMISKVVHDEHSRNTYLFANCFSAADVSPNLVFGTVLDNQKAVTVQGTFLQNTSYMDVFYREGYTVIEMEAGPFLSAIYEMFRPIRHPVNEIVNLYELPFDLGMVHYASDTPLGKGKNLGAGSLSYNGMDFDLCGQFSHSTTHSQPRSRSPQTKRNPHGKWLIACPMTN